VRKLLKLGACAAAALLLGAGSPPAYRPGAADVPRTEKPFGDHPADFNFVVLGDRTGKHRPGVFEAALKQVEQFHPEFVINVGDLIEGNTEDRAKLASEWGEITAATEAIDIAFFYVPGNHDLSNEVMRSDWRKRLGADYYSFTYKNVLFLVLNTEDPPQPQNARAPLLEQYGAGAMARVSKALQGDPAEAEALFRSDPKLAELAEKLKRSEKVNFSADQLAMVRKALAANKKPRWTFVLMHRPAWKVDSAEFRGIEKLLAGRPYTVLAGHYHKYAYEQRAGRDYIQLGTTGGMPGAGPDDPGVVDHLMWISVTGGQPRISNIRLDGIFDCRGPARAGRP
jgi:hypothetical protein